MCQEGKVSRQDQSDRAAAGTANGDRPSRVSTGGQKDHTRQRFHFGLAENSSGIQYIHKEGCIPTEFGLQIPRKTFSGFLSHSRLGIRCPIKAEPPAWTSVLISEILSESTGGDVCLTMALGIRLECLYIALGYKVDELSSQEQIKFTGQN